MLNLNGYMEFLLQKKKKNLPTKGKVVGKNENSGRENSGRQELDMMGRIEGSRSNSHVLSIYYLQVKGFMWIHPLSPQDSRTDIIPIPHLRDAKTEAPKGGHLVQPRLQIESRQW